MDKWLLKWGLIITVGLLFGPMIFAMCDDHARDKSRLRFCEKNAQTVEAYKECIKK